MSLPTTLRNFPSTPTTPSSSFDDTRDQMRDDFNDAVAAQQRLIGIAVGVPVGLFLIFGIAIGWWCIRRSKRKKKSQWTPPVAQPLESQQTNPQQSLFRNGENGAAVGYKPELHNQHQMELESQTQGNPYHELNAQNAFAQGGRVEATDGRPQPQELPMHYNPQELPVNMRNGRVQGR